MLEVQFSEQLGAAPYERSPEWLGYRAELLLVGHDPLASPPSSTGSSCPDTCALPSGPCGPDGSTVQVLRITTL